MRPGTIAALCAALIFNVGAHALESVADVERTVAGTRTTEGIPALSVELSERLARYQNTRGATFAGWLDEGGLLITTRFGETDQVHRVAQPLGMREQLTFFSEPLMATQATPGKGPDGFVFGKDVGGSEFWQLHFYDMATREIELLTDGKRSRNERAVLSRDGNTLAYSSTARNGTDGDLWVRGLTEGTPRLLASPGGTWYPLDFSPDGKRLLVAQAVSITDVRPGVVDVETGKLERFPVDGGKAGFGAFRFAPDGRAVYFISDEESEFRTLRHHDPDAGTPPAVLTRDLPWDVEDFRIAADGGHIAYSTNEDGIGKLSVLRLPSHERVALPALPIGVIGNFGFSPDGRQLALTLSTATSPSDVYVIALTDRSLVRWTRSEVGGLDPADFVEPTLVRYPTFDRIDGKPRTIPAFQYRPRRAIGNARFPVVINIHGGPEGQARPAFDPTAQFLANDLGVAVLVPNVRGSSGYGKNYLGLDNGVRREDSVKDIGALLDWIATQPGLDADRVGVYGGSYGGYMVLASMVHYGDRLRAGVEIVGISDFRTFLANTEDYRRDLRRAEYGDERDPAMAEHFARIAPLARAGGINKPLFVAQGLNDPRVPASEAAQIVKAVRANGTEVWYLEQSDEGHGFRKKSNRDYFNTATMAFWMRHLVPPVGD